MSRLYVYKYLWRNYLRLYLCVFLALKGIEYKTTTIHRILENEITRFGISV